MLCTVCMHVCMYVCIGKYYAIKIVDKAFITKHNKVKYVLQEKKLLTLIKHPNIVKLHYSFQDRLSLCMYVCMYV